MNNQANPTLFGGEQAPRESVRNQLAPQDPKYPSPIIHHWVLQLNGVAPEQISDPAGLESVLTGVVAELDLTRVSSHSHYFGPGVSTVIILSESHLAAHTWPELGYIHLDIVTCTQGFEAAKLQTAFQNAFNPESLQLLQVLY